MWLALAVAVSYANVLTGGFQFDDYNVIVNEAQVHSWANWYASLGNGIRPLLKLSYTANWTMGLGVLGFHITNLLIHLANAYLVYRLSQLFVQQQSRSAALHHAPLLTALLFAVHPIHTEAVSYISGRSASLMTLFYLAALLSYVIGRMQHKPLFAYVATPILFVLALAVKETAVTLPLALLLWEASCGGRWRFEFKPQWTSWLLLFIAAVFFLFDDNYLSQIERSAQLNGLQGNLATQLTGFIYLLQQFVLPLWQNIDPDLPLLHELAEAIFPLTITIVLLGLMIACWRGRPWISFALGWMMLHLIPLYILLPRIDIANERQLYLAAWPLLLALAIELTLFLDGKRWRFVAAGLLTACVVLTASRNQVYQNEVALWEDTVVKSPSKARAHNNLGYAYLLAQRKAEARRELTVALQLDPQLYQARYNLRKLEEELISSP